MGSGARVRPVERVSGSGVGETLSGVVGALGGAVPCDGAGSPPRRTEVISGEGWRSAGSADPVAPEGDAAAGGAPVGLDPLVPGGIATGIDLDKLVDTGAFISDFLGRKPNSNVAKAILNKRAG